MRINSAAAAFLFIAALSAGAQEAGLQGLSPYLIPQTVYVGDRARMVVPLGQAFASVPAFVSNSPETLFKGGSADALRDAAVSRIELEQRSGGSRLLIDFVPYVTGAIYFPDLAVPGDAGLEVSGLRAAVASILEPHEASLSGAAAPLAAPGTGFIMYGTLVLALAFLFLCAGGVFWYRNRFAEYRARLKRRRLLKAMDRLLRQMAALSGGEESREGLFSVLSKEFREFLSLFTGIDCRALTPGEFASLELPASESVSRDFLYETFSRWEAIRFSGSEINWADFTGVLDGVRAFISGLEAAERAAKNPPASGDVHILAGEGGAL